MSKPGEERQPDTPLTPEVEEAEVWSDGGPPTATLTWLSPQAPWPEPGSPDAGPNETGAPSASRYARRKAKP